VPNLDSLKKLLNYQTVFTVTAFLLLSLTVVNLVSTNMLATQGFAVSESETNTLKLEKENHRLSVKIEEAARLRGLEETATQNGFVRVKSIVFVQAPPTFASR